MNDRKHQDVEINYAGLPVRLIQRQDVWPGQAKHADYEPGKLGARHLELVQEALQSFVVRLDLRRAVKGIGQDREIDGLHGIEPQKKARI